MLLMATSFARIYLKEQKFSIENENILCEDKSLSNKLSIKKEEDFVSRENIHVIDEGITDQNSLLNSPSPPVDEELLQQDATFISLIEQPICLINVKEENSKGELNFTKYECP